MRSDKARTALAAAALIALNMWICWRLFFVEYTPHWYSIEGSFIAITRYISRHWGDFSWWPIWHCGMPYQDVYVPLFHLTSAAVTTLAELPAGRAYHFVAGVAYALGPATLFLMAIRLGAPRGAAFLGALAYSLLSPSAWVLPEFAADIGGPLYSRRLQVLTVYGEGPHITAMTLLPLAILALHNAMERRTSRAFALAALAIAAVFLTNVPGTMALGLAAFCWLCTQPRRAWGVAIAASLLAYGIACFGVPPSSYATVVSNSGRMHGGFSTSLKQAPYLLPALLFGIAGLGYVLRRINLPTVIRFSALYAVLTAVLVVTARRSEKFELLPQAVRLHLEMEMGICLLIGALLWAVYTAPPRWLRPLLVALFLVPLYIQIQNYRFRARIDIQPSDPTTRSEYTSAMWLDRNLPGQRVYTMGSTGFWLNAFADNPQLIGCCDQGQAMPILEGVPYLIKAREDLAGLAKTWLQAFGVQAMVVNGPESTDEYKDFLQPDRFGPLLRVLHRERGDTIYAIPQRSTSFAYVLRSGEVAARQNIQAYVDAIQDTKRPPADFLWLNGSTARIRARLASDDLVSVQVAWLNGWKAWIGGVRQTVVRDGIGFILIRPNCEGECEILLRWTGPPDYWYTAAASLACLVAAIVMIARR